LIAARFICTSPFATRISPPSTFAWSLPDADGPTLLI
jgi:hypothetical protein